MRLRAEVEKWVYLLLISVVLFLFLCLCLDAFCYFCLGGWQALTGKWPIFRGTVSVALYGDLWMVVFLVFALTAMARISVGRFGFQKGGGEMGKIEK